MCGPQTCLGTTPEPQRQRIEHCGNVGRAPRNCHSERSEAPLGRIAFLLLLTALVLSLTSCTGSGDWRGLVKVGLIAPFSGYDSESADHLLQATRTTIRQWNERGGIRGHRIELIALDDGNDSSVAASRVREMAIDRDLIAVIARLNGRSELAVGEYERLALPVVAIGSPLPADSGQAPLWRMCADAAGEGRRAAEFALGELRAARPVVVAALGAGYRAAAMAFEEAFGSRAAHFAAPFDGPSSPGQEGDAVAGLAQAVADARADFVYFSGRYDSGALFAAALRQRSPARLLLGSDADTPALARLSPFAGQDVAYVASCQGAPVEQPVGAADGPGRRGKAGEALAILARDATQLVLAAAAGAAGTAPPGRAAVAAAMRSGGYLEGMSGTITFDRMGGRRGAAAVIHRTDGT